MKRSEVILNESGNGEIWTKSLFYLFVKSYFQIDKLSNTTFLPFLTMFYCCIYNENVVNRAPSALYETKLAVNNYYFNRFVKIV